MLTAASIHDPTMRAEAMLEHLRSSKESDVARAFEQLCVESERGDSRAMAALHVLVCTITRPEHEPIARKILFVATNIGLTWVRFLLSGFEDLAKLRAAKPVEPWDSSLDLAAIAVVHEMLDTTPRPVPAQKPSANRTTGVSNDNGADDAESSLGDIEDSHDIHDLHDLHEGDAADDPEVTDFLLTHGIAEETTMRREENVPNYGTARPLTLGERKSLARKPTRAQMARLLRDPNPSVIKILLQNPMVTEDDVLRIAAMRPGVPEVLREVAHHARWMSQPRVLRALVLNPATPLEIAVSRVFLLPRQDLAFAATTFGTPATVRTVAEAVLATRTVKR